VSFAKKIVVTHCARAVYTARVPVHGTYTVVYTARTRPCTRPVHGRVHRRVHTHTCTPPLQGRVRAIYTAVYTTSTQPYTRTMYMARTRLRKCSCTQAVYTSRRVHGRWAYWAMYTLPDGTLRPCAAHHGRVHGPFTAHSRQCIRPCTTAVTRPSDTCIRLHRS